MRKTIFIILGCIAIVSFYIICCEWTERDTLEVNFHNLVTKRVNAKADTEKTGAKIEPIAEDMKDSAANNSLVERLTDAEALDGWIGSCPWVTWKSDRYRFRVQYPYFMNVVEYLTHDDCIYLQWEMLKMIGKMYECSSEECSQSMRAGILVFPVFPFLANHPTHPEDHHYPADNRWRICSCHPSML